MSIYNTYYVLTTYARIMSFIIRGIAIKDNFGGRTHVAESAIQEEMSFTFPSWQLFWNISTVSDEIYIRFVVAGVISVCFVRLYTRTPPRIYGRTLFRTRYLYIGFFLYALIRSRGANRRTAEQRISYNLNPCSWLNKYIMLYLLIREY